MASFTSSQVGSSPDYMRYLWKGSLTKTDHINQPDLLDFALYDFDGQMVKLTRGAHISISTRTYGIWFTGYITSDPELQYLGTINGQQVYGYVYQATSEEYLLNLRPLGIIPPYTNTTQGRIIKDLIRRLSPVGVSFNTTFVQDGQIVPRYVCDPNKHFSDVIKDMTGSAHYQFRVQNYAATYRPLDSVPCGVQVDGSDRFFNPSGLSIKPSQDPIINDSIILGDIEPQNYMNEFFAGDGATAQYPLISSVFGVDSTLLLDDDFSSSTIDNSKWSVYDANAGYLQPSGGFLNVLGGNNNNSFDVSLQSLNLIPLEGNLRCTHGEYDFISACDGIIGGLWTGNVGADLTQCAYGIRALKGTDGKSTVLHPIVNGVVDYNQTCNIDYTKRYVLRTLCIMGDAKRQAASFAYIDATGNVVSLQGPSSTAYGEFSTVITEIDPTNANITKQWDWLNTAVPVSATYCTYAAVAVNNMHLSLTGVTVSFPMQATLKVKSFAVNPPAPTLGKGIRYQVGYWTPQHLGPNEIDSMDGMAPVATIVDSNNGASTRSSFLGTPNYNPGQATLTYFKDSARMISNIPAVGAVSRLTYRSAGAAIGWVRDPVSVAAEAAAWGDDGIRSKTDRSLSPLPRSSEECELAAKATVLGNNYQHWSGSYKVYSGTWITSEPLSGTILRFSNLPPQFSSSLKAEEVTQVKSTLLSTRPQEYFLHEIDFGVIDVAAQAVATFLSTNDVFAPQDTAQMPQYINPASVGSTRVPALQTCSVYKWDQSYFYFSVDNGLPVETPDILTDSLGNPIYAFGTEPIIVGDTHATGGIEVRFTDTNWGADDSTNLIMRSSSPYFTLPRNTTGKVAFVRCYDVRNYALYSEDITRAVPDANVYTSQVRAQDIDNNYRMIGIASLTNLTSGYINFQCNAPSTPNKTYTFTASVMAPADAYFQLIIKDGVQNATMGGARFLGTGKWQRVSVTADVTSNLSTVQVLGKVLLETPQRVYYVDQWSLEPGLRETVYCKTNGIPYGVTSRYSMGVHCALPLIPPAPTLTGAMNSSGVYQLTVNLPALMDDVWGVEVRDADNKTVLYKANLNDTSFMLTFTPPTPTSRTPTYWAYTYNLFGEYSPPYHTPLTPIAKPTVTTLAVNTASSTLTWNHTGAKRFTVTGASTDVITTSDTKFTLSPALFFGNNSYTVTPYDDIGPGDPVTINHQYVTPPVVSFSGTEVGAATAATAANAGGIVSLSQYKSLLTNEVLKNKMLNQYK